MLIWLRIFQYIFWGTWIAITPLHRENFELPNITLLPHIILNTGYIYFYNDEQKPPVRGLTIQTCFSLNPLPLMLVPSSILFVKYPHFSHVLSMAFLKFIVKTTSLFVKIFFFISGHFF